MVFEELPSSPPGSPTSGFPLSFSRAPLGFRVAAGTFIDPALFNCNMERTKLSTKQIKHALPEWMFTELIETHPGERRPKKTRRGSRQGKKNRERRRESFDASAGLGSCGGVDLAERVLTTRSASAPVLSNGIGSTNTSSPVAFPSLPAPAVPRRRGSAGSPAALASAGSSLSKKIASLPNEMQKCFSEWRRERKQAIASNDERRQRKVEKVMWQALNNITSRMVVKA